MTEEVKEPKEPIEEPKPEEPKTYTQEELDAQLKDQYDKLNVTLSEQGAELKRLKRKPAQPSPSVQAPTLSKIIAEMERREKEVGDNPEALQRLAELRAEATQQEQRQVIETVTKDWRGRLEQQIKDAGQDPTDETFDDVWESFDMAYAIDGKFERAEKKLGRVLAKVKPIEPKKEEKPKETEDERVERLAEEKHRKWMEEKGYLATEPGGPSGAASKWEEVRDKYIKDPTNPRVKAEYFRLRAERGL